jgi:hypothetical protein
LKLHSVNFLTFLLFNIRVLIITCLTLSSDLFLDSVYSCFCLLYLSFKTYSYADYQIVLMLHHTQVFDISSLQIFTPHELDYLLCGRRELWEVISLTCAILHYNLTGTFILECHGPHGYTLISILCRLRHLLII